MLYQIGAQEQKVTSLFDDDFLVTNTGPSSVFVQNNAGAAQSNGIFLPVRASIPWPISEDLYAVVKPPAVTTNDNLFTYETLSGLSIEPNPNVVNNPSTLGYYDLIAQTLGSVAATTALCLQAFDTQIYNTLIINLTYTQGTAVVPLIGQFNIVFLYWYDGAGNLIQVDEYNSYARKNDSLILTAPVRGAYVGISNTSQSGILPSGISIVGTNNIRPPSQQRGLGAYSLSATILGYGVDYVSLDPTVTWNGNNIFLPSLGQTLQVTVRVGNTVTAAGSIAILDIQDATTRLHIGNDLPLPTATGPQVYNLNLSVPVSGAYLLSGTVPTVSGGGIISIEFVWKST